MSNSNTNQYFDVIINSLENKTVSDYSEMELDIAQFIYRNDSRLIHIINKEIKKRSSINMDKAKLNMSDLAKELKVYEELYIDENATEEDIKYFEMKIERLMNLIPVHMQ